ncbi:MAG: hypothetical protein Q9222_003751 [Ikaeria aurantiellina]
MAPHHPPTAKHSSEYPKPLIIPPLNTHRQTFIILHGRGSNAQTFAPPLLSTKISESETLQSSFPHAKFIFPTASKRRAQIYNRATINQWFDNWSPKQPDERTELQIEGLRERSSYIHSLLASAVEEVGAKNVVLGGLSQGCAAALIALLMWEGEAIGGVFGMCGWLPFRREVSEVAEMGCGDDGDANPFAEEGREEGDDGPSQAVAFLREHLGMPISKPSMSFQGVPIFLGHGVEDEKVPVQRGREAVACLKLLGATVEWQEYEGLGHWYSDKMLDRLVKSLQSVLEKAHTSS